MYAFLAFRVTPLFLGTIETGGMWPPNPCGAYQMLGGFIVMWVLVFGVILYIVTTKWCHVHRGKMSAKGAG